MKYLKKKKKKRDISIFSTINTLVHVIAGHVSNKLFMVFLTYMTKAVNIGVKRIIGTSEMQPVL